MIRLLLFLMLASPALHFDIVDARGKKPSGVSVEADAPDADGWCPLKVVNKNKASAGKPQPVYVFAWPYDARAKVADGPGDIPVLLFEAGDPKVLANPKLVAALGAAKLLGQPVESGFDAAALEKALAALTTSEDPFAKGVALLAANKPSDAVEPLSRVLRERERQLTRVPSELYPAAILAGRALLGAGKYDLAAVAFLKALHQRPSSEDAKRFRAEALEKAGKADAK